MTAEQLTKMLVNLASFLSQEERDALKTKLGEVDEGDFVEEFIEILGE